MKTYEELLNEMFYVTKAEEVQNIISELGDRIEWRPVGNNMGNFAIINTGSNPYEGITERITNAIDAMIELNIEVVPELRNCQNPRQAIESIYGIRDGNLKTCDDDQTISKLASNIRVKFQDSGDPKKPTLEISDKGIGQHPTDFPSTLLGLNDDYKISKLYLMGAFGQGGQMSFSNSDYAVVMSRKDPRLLRNGQLDNVGWSIVRYRDRSDENTFYKHGVYEYCINTLTGSVLTADPHLLNRAFSNGTIIKLIAYSIPRGTTDVLQPSSTAWSFLSQSLFDPLLPFRLHEERKIYQRRDRTLSGLARRLWRGGKGEKAYIWNKDSYEITMGEHGAVTLNYWALSPSNETENWKDIRKGLVSNLDAGFFTLNGQTHERISPLFLRDKVRLPYSFEYLIVQVDCDNLTKESKKELLSTTRENFKDKDLKETLFNEVATHLRLDRNILLFEEERKKKILSTKSKRDTSRIRNLVAKYIANNEELKQLLQKKGTDKIEAKIQKKRESEEDRIQDVELSVPLLRPVPTYLLIKNSKEPIPIEKGGNALIRLETDAEDDYLDEGKGIYFRAIHKDGLTQKHSISRLRKGKISYYVHCPESVRVGSKEELRFELDLLGSAPLFVERKLICVSPYEREKIVSNEAIREPLIHEVSENDEPELWGQFGWDRNSVGRVIIETSNPGIYVSVDNRELRKVVAKYDSDLEEAIRDRYVAGIAYYLLLKRVEEMRTGGENGTMERTDLDDDNSQELQRLAKVVSAMSMPIETQKGSLRLPTSQN